MNILAGKLSEPAYLAEAFADYFLGDAVRSSLPGGRAAGLERLHGYDATRYGRTRNFLDAPVSRLSAYLRHGMPCIDGMLHSLFTEGYLHNHERLWFAAYFCHFRGLSWQAGARLFRQYLLDGDRASNSASWQWVESAGCPHGRSQCK